MTDTGFKDKNGCPIHEGDLVEVQFYTRFSPIGDDYSVYLTSDFGYVISCSDGYVIELDETRYIDLDEDTARDSVEVANKRMCYKGA